MVNRWVADLGPIQWISGKTAKFPTKEPTFDIVIKYEISAKVSGPVGNVLFCSCRSFELIVAQPDIVNNENINKLPVYEISTIVNIVLIFFLQNKIIHNWYIETN